MNQETLWIGAHPKLAQVLLLCSWQKILTAPSESHPKSDIPRKIGSGNLFILTPGTTISGTFQSPSLGKTFWFVGNVDG